MKVGERMRLSPEELLAGTDTRFEIQVPAAIWQPGSDDPSTERSVLLKPLSVQDLQLLTRAAKEQDRLLLTLMVQRALLEPELSVAQVASLPVGVVQFIGHHVNRISGIAATSEEVAAAAETPVARAAFALSRAYGWTPQQVAELTLGQVLLHLQMLKEHGSD